MSVNPVNYGTCGIVAPKQPQKTPSDIIRDRMELRREIQEEIRYNDLCKRAKNGTITPKEMQELKEMKMVRALEDFVINSKPTIMYCA